MVAATQFQGVATPGSLMSGGRESDWGMRRRGRLLAFSSVYSRASGGDLSPLVGINRRGCMDGRCRFCEFTGIRRISPVVMNQMKRRGSRVRAEFSPGNDIGSRDTERQVNLVSIKDERRQREDPARVNSVALIASSLPKADYRSVRELTDFVLKIGLLTGVSLAAILGLCFDSTATFFTNDIGVLQIVKTGLLFVCASQPLNALPYIFYGLHYGDSDFPYVACSMILVGAISSVFLLYIPSVIGLSGVWMGLRTVAGFFRYFW